MKTFQKIASILLLVLYLSPLFQSIGSIGFYVTNLEYIENNLCENRDKPSIACNGTCVLAKMLNESPTSDNPFEEAENTGELELILAFNHEDKSENSFKSLQKIDFDGFLQKQYQLLLTKTLLDPPDHLA